jgi:hypothetical protein
MELGCSWQFRFTRPVFLWSLAALLTDDLVENVAAPQRSALGREWWALLPVIPALLFVVFLVRAVQKMDELQQRICLESVFIAFMLTLALAFVTGGLARAGIYHPPFDSLGTPMMGFFACAYVYSAWRYR